MPTFEEIFNLLIFQRSFVWRCPRTKQTYLDEKVKHSVSQQCVNMRHSTTRVHVRT